VTTTAGPLVRVNEPSVRIRGRVRDLLQYRELIGNLVRKELRVKYKNSVLGFVWSMLNPALVLAIFWIVFTKFLPAGVPQFPIFLLSGLLGWNLWSASLGGSVSSLLGNASLVTKVYFPREVLPISTIGASLMHYFFQLVVLLLALAAFRYPVSPASLLLVPTALIVELMVLAGFCLIVAVLNVYFRDVQHLLELLLLAWFWMTPIVYPIMAVKQNLDRFPILWRIYLLNPMTHIVLGFQRGIYAKTDPVDANGVAQSILVPAPIWWYLRNLGIVALGATILFAFGWRLFQRLESRLAEEL
jgi:ABC-2 type transport system permease protein